MAKPGRPNSDTGSEERQLSNYAFGIQGAVAMKIQFEVGDLVYEPGYYGCHTFTVKKVNKNTLTVENSRGERFSFGIKQTYPTRGTLARATIIREDKP